MQSQQIEKGTPDVVRKHPGLTGLPPRLTSADRAGTLRYLGTNRPYGEYAVEVHGQEREYSGIDMIDWLNGYTAGQLGKRQPVENRDPATIASVRAVLINPSLIDQVRIRARLAIQQAGLTVTAVSERIGVTRKGLSGSLQLGTSGTIGILAVLGHDPAARPDLAERDGSVPLEAAPPAGWTEPDVIARLRALGYAHEQGVARWASPTDVNKAYYTRTFALVIGDRETYVHTDQVRSYVIGVADAIVPDAGDAMYAALVAERAG